MIGDEMSVDNGGHVGRDRVCVLVSSLLRGALAAGFTDEALAASSGVSARCIKSYRCEGREPPLSAALSLGVALGQPAVNAILSLIGYSARPTDANEAAPGVAVAEIIGGLQTIAEAAADGRIDHTEAPRCETAANKIIAAAARFQRGQAA